MSTPTVTVRGDSLEFLTGTVESDHDITGDPVAVSLPTSGSEASTFVDAEDLGTVEGTDTDGNPIWTKTFRVLVGTGGDIALAKGKYDWLVRVTDDPEVPVVKGGIVIIAP